MNNTLHWGIIGLGKIANNFALDLVIADHCVLSAVASRSLEKAKSFQQEYGAKSAYGNYEEILEDPLVDIIYIATPHNLHKEWSIRAMQAGKHVLCEKPAGVNQQELVEMIDVARANHVFFMEALWTRFNPTINEVLSRIKNGEIGHVKAIQADFQFKAKNSDESRLFNPQLAGGATLDIGIYPLFLSYLILGTPKSIHAKSIMHTTNVDIQTSVICQYDNAMSNLYFGLNSNSDNEAKIYGDKGFIQIHGRWHESSSYTINIDGENITYHFQLLGRGYSLEAEACHQAISQGKSQSYMWRHEDSINLISMCDQVRKQIGLQYPFE